jgi:SPP1 gp7 family putative phage head morphogenesis protein
LALEVRQFFLVTDALGLKEKPRFFTLAQPSLRQYEFQTNPDKLRSFSEWFQQQVDAEILSPKGNARPDMPWTAEYVESAYKMGLLNSYFASKRGLLDDEIFADMTREEFLRQAFMSAEAVGKIKLLATRAYEQLKGINGTMAAEMNRILASGIAEGRNIDSIAREMHERIGINLERAKKIARTEIIYAHAEGQLDSFEKLGIDQIGVLAEWSTAGDGAVCPKCHSLEGATFTVAEARGLIPLHPNCRCAWIPKVL